ncbi:MAG: class I SAM-dependent methyltransferase [Candidatus Taylorbacteria bacterium]|nr:class I SAM-dependent methyltransferase [Candidatus Taylorbacteria bacterium]
MHNEVKQFDTISDKYASFVDGDPIRNYLHYPTVVELLGDIKGKYLLDVGCGDGLFDRKLTKEFGAKVWGYDKASDLIALAKNDESKYPLGITYSVDDPLTFHTGELFDECLSVMVLSYAPDANYLINFFDSTYKVLKEGGRFLSVIFNPSFKAFDCVIANRIFKIKDGKVEVNFLKPKTNEVKFTALLTQFSIEEYTDAARAAGFKKITWEKLYPTKEGVAILGEDFWRLCEQEQPYVVLITEK